MALLGVGDVPYDSFARKLPNPSRGGGVFDAQKKPDLPPLPASRAEIESAVSIFAHGSVELLGKQATEANLKKEPLDRFTIIHLAVHAFSDPKDQARVALLLAPDESGQEDGFLQPREISQLPIAAKVVVLSACNTGAGPSFGQDGIANLARAFLIAGASSVVTTLWSVSDTGSSVSWSARKQLLRKCSQPQGSQSNGIPPTLPPAGTRRSASEVRTRAALPQVWAMTQNNLGVALRDQTGRTSGQAGVDLLAQAVAAYRSALEVRIRAALPQDWAATQTNLGVALRDQAERTRGPAAVDLLANRSSFCSATYRSKLQSVTWARSRRSKTP